MKLLEVEGGTALAQCRIAGDATAPGVFDADQKPTNISKCELTGMVDEAALIKQRDNEA